MRSLLSRLNAGLMVSLVVLFAAQWVLVSISIRYLVESYVAGRLGHDTESLLSALTLMPDGKVSLDLNRVNPVFQRPFSGHYYDIRVSSAPSSAPGSQTPSLRSRSLWDEDLPDVSAGVGESILSHLDGPLGQELLLRTSGFDKQGHRIIIAMAEDLSPLNANVWEFRKRYAWVSVVILAALIALQTGIVRVSLRPLRQAREDLARLERGEVQRINSEVPAEIIPLVDELNRMVQVMSARLERSRNALGNLAHALKTPLTLLTRLADDPALERSTALRERLLQHVSSLNRLVERELKRARLAGGAMPGQQVDLQQEIGSLVVALKRIHHDKRLDIQCDIRDGARFPGDREDLLELLGNLMDNACKWAKERVLVTLEQGEKLTLRVEDDGPGCPGDLLDDLLRRGVRVDESRAGHGLGLAIARDVVTSYGGEIQLGRSAALGGFEAVIDLPGAPSSTRLPSLAHVLA